MGRRLRGKCPGTSMEKVKAEEDGGDLRKTEAGV